LSGRLPLRLIVSLEIFVDHLARDGYTSDMRGEVPQAGKNPKMGGMGRVIAVQRMEQWETEYRRYRIVSGVYRFHAIFFSD